MQKKVVQGNNLNGDPDSGVQNVCVAVSGVGAPLIIEIGGGEHSIQANFERLSNLRVV